MKKLNVVYAGWGERWSLGTLADNGRDILFEYSHRAIQEGLELSPRHLKLRPEAYSGLPGFIEDALPDGWGRLLIDRLFRRAGREPSTLSQLDRLAFIGDTAMGALVFEPAEPKREQPDVSLLQLARDVRTIQMDGESEPVLQELVTLGGSPHGARPKVLAYYNPGLNYLSTRPFEGGEPWLFKFPAKEEHPEVCALEQVYAELAHACGLSISFSRYFTLNAELTAFGARRFDRVNALRVPMQTLAGLLHADFRIPGSVDYLTFLRATMFLTRDVREVEAAYARAVFNVVFHNRDDHSKNVAYRLNERRHWQLAPAYDLTFSQGPGGEHHMDVAGEGGTITRHHLLKLATDADLNLTLATRLLDTMLIQQATFAERARQYPIRNATVQTISRALNTIRQRLV